MSNGSTIIQKMVGEISIIHPLVVVVPDDDDDDDVIQRNVANQNVAANIMMKLPIIV